jgi:DNA-binding MarR family transcriptional regulator
MAEGWQIAVELLRASRALIDATHARLAERGHPDLRPAHGYAFQAIGADGLTASELGQALGITKQAAGQMVDELLRLGYVRREPDPGDARRKRVMLTAHGIDALARSAEVFDEVCAQWATRLPPSLTLDDLLAALRAGSAGAPQPGGALRPVW